MCQILYVVFATDLVFFMLNNKDIYADVTTITYHTSSVTHVGTLFNKINFLSLIGNLNINKTGCEDFTAQQQ